MKLTTVYLEENQVERLKQVAATKGIKRHSSLIRIAVEEYLEKEEAKVKK